MNTAGYEEVAEIGLADVCGFVDKVWFPVESNEETDSTEDCDTWNGPSASFCRGAIIKIDGCSGRIDHVPQKPLVWDLEFSEVSSIFMLSGMMDESPPGYMEAARFILACWYAITQGKDTAFEHLAIFHWGVWSR